MLSYDIKLERLIILIDNKKSSSVIYYNLTYSIILYRQLKDIFIQYSNPVDFTTSTSILMHILG